MKKQNTLVISFYNNARPLFIIVYYQSLTLFTDKRLDHVTIENDVIISIIRNINPNKAPGFDGISG